MQVAEDLIFDRRREGYDPLQRLLEIFADRKAADAAARKRAETVEGRLKDRIVDGDRKGLDDDLDEALQVHAPLDIINTILLDGMKVVGELFGAGKMQLPFVLQSAETMKAAVAYLEPHMERVEGQEKGTIVLATVKGDVHDIGKNLVDIILTNNGYRVVNLGIKVPLADMLDGRARAPRACHRHVRPAGEIHRGDAREPGGDVAPGPRYSGAAGRRGADAQLCRGGLRARLCLRAAWPMRATRSTGCI